MQLTTHSYGVVLGLLLMGLTLLGLPLSVFSQESVVDSEPVVSEEVNSSSTLEASEPYKIEPIPDPDGRVFGDFLVGPGKLDLEIEPGQSKVVEITITNRMGEEKWFEFAVEDTRGSNDPARPIVLLGSDTGPYTLKDFISIPALKFKLGHMERARVPVTISLPPDAEPGGRYGSVVVSTVTRDANLNPEGGAAPSSAIVSRLGTLFFVTVPGSEDLSGQLVSFDTVSKKHLFFSGPINFAILFENTGSVHLGPYGILSITNLLGEEVGYQELDTWFAMPKSLRTREISWNRELLIGRYVATVKVNRGYEDIVDEISLVFWVLPWKLMLALFVTIFAVIYLIRFTSSRFEFKRK